MLHILNGGALLERFPEDIGGIRLVCHECFIEGPVKADSLRELGIMRSQYLYKTYNAPYEDYIAKMADPFDVLETLDPSIAIHLWFEEDLFCQTNMWYMIHLLMHYNLANKIFLVRPHTNLQCGFGALGPDDLKAVIEKKEEISAASLDVFDGLWVAYSHGDTDAMRILGELLLMDFPFVLEAIDAHIKRQESVDSIGMPKETLVSISRELGTQDFGLIFREFSKRLPIYGFGDLQVRRLWEEVQIGYSL